MHWQPDPRPPAPSVRPPSQSLCAIHSAATLQNDRYLRFDRFRLAEAAKPRTQPAPIERPLGLTEWVTCSAGQGRVPAKQIWCTAAVPSQARRFWLLLPLWLQFRRPRRSTRALRSCQSRASSFAQPARHLLLPRPSSACRSSALAVPAWPSLTSRSSRLRCGHALPRCGLLASQVQKLATR